MDNFVKRQNVTMINGQLISNQYAEQLMDEIYELLSDQGCLLIQDLTTKYNLPLDFMRECINLRLDSHLPPGTQLQGNSLITQTYAERQLAKVRGVLRAITRPAALSAIAQAYRIEEQKFKNMADQLIREG